MSKFPAPLYSAGTLLWERGVAESAIDALRIHWTITKAPKGMSHMDMMSHPELSNLVRGCDLVCQKAIKSMLTGKSLPTMPTKTQAEYGITPEYLQEINQMIKQASEQAVLQLLDDLSVCAQLFGPKVAERLTEIQ